MVTIKDVARVAQVSTATVSRTLAEPEKVSKATRSKVMKAVKETGYVANTLARNFRRRKTNTIMVLVPDISNVFFSDIIKGIEKIALENRYNVLLGDTNNDPDREKLYASLVEQKQCDGIISLSRNIPFNVSKGCETLDSNWPPFMMACEYSRQVSIPTVCIDNKQAAFEAVEYLLSLGHRRVAYVNGPSDSPLCIDRRNGYIKALKTLSIEYDERLEVNGDFSIQSGQLAMRQLLELPVRPTAVFLANDEMALGAINTIHKLGLSIPGDISVMGFDDIHFSEFSYPPLTTVHQPRTEIGKEVMMHMLDILNGKQKESKRFILQHKLVIRDSCAEL